MLRSSGKENLAERLDEAIKPQKIRAIKHQFIALY
jgi:hypothetical protein